MKKQQGFLAKAEAQQGFTLIEMLLVVTLIAISVGVTSDILLSLVRSYNKTTVINEVEQQANFVGLKIEKELRSATNVSVEAGGSRLSFEYEGETVYYNIEDNNIFRSTSVEDSTSPDDALVATPDINQTIGGVNLTCEGVCFTLSGTSPQIVGYDFIFAQSAAGGISFRGQIHIKNTVVVRNTY